MIWALKLSCTFSKQGTRVQLNRVDDEDASTLSQSRKYWGMEMKSRVWERATDGRLTKRWSLVQEYLNPIANFNEHQGRDTMPIIGPSLHPMENAEGLPDRRTRTARSTITNHRWASEGRGKANVTVLTSRLLQSAEVIINELTISLVQTATSFSSTSRARGQPAVHMTVVGTGIAGTPKDPCP